MTKYLMPVMTALFIGCGLTANAQLVINELMQSNIDCLMDDLKEFPDSWVELYNPSDFAQWHPTGPRLPDRLLRSRGQGPAHAFQVGIGQGRR